MPGTPRTHQYAGMLNSLMERLCRDTQESSARVLTEITSYALSEKSGPFYLMTRFGKVEWNDLLNEAVDFSPGSEQFPRPEQSVSIKIHVLPEFLMRTAHCTSEPRDVCKPKLVLVALYKHAVQSVRHYRKRKQFAEASEAIAVRPASNTIVTWCNE